MKHGANDDSLAERVRRGLLQHEASLRASVRGKLIAQAFDNRFTLHPRRLAELAEEEVTAFVDFLCHRDRKCVVHHGATRVAEGLGERVVLDEVAIYREHCVSACADAGPDVLRAGLGLVDVYLTAYLEGYLAETEAQILRDQEQMRRALSAALERQRRELLVKDHAMNTSINGIMLMDLRGHVTYVNPAFLSMWGYDSTDEVLGAEGKEILGDERPDDAIHLVEKLGRHGWRGELPVRRKDRSSFEVEVSASYIRDDTGSPIGIMASFIDITERKRLEQEIRQAQKMEAVNTLAGGIAHDFNNLLTTIQGNTSLMLFDVEADSPFYERLKMIEKQVQSGSRLTSQLLGYARKGRYEVKPLDLNKLIEETSSTLSRTRKDITIVLDLAPKLLAVEADQGQLEQVLLNLYINAADAMPAGGTLTIKTSNVGSSQLKRKADNPRASEYAKLVVVDTGTGMDKGTMERIFDPFFTTKEMGRGTGLGLASVYGIVRGHGGFIEVDSKKGKGSTFTICLPATRKGIARPEAAVGEIERGSETILLVDDEEMVLDVGTRVLKTLGYDVLPAKNAREALRIYQSRKDDISLVILDMIMPGMSGGEAFDRLRQINAGVKVLLASGYSIDGQASEILNRGCNGFAQKPFDIRRLSKKIREIIEAA